MEEVIAAVKEDAQEESRQQRQGKDETAVYGKGTAGVEGAVRNRRLHLQDDKQISELSSIEEWWTTRLGAFPE